jgi:hypothetical protein
MNAAETPGIPGSSSSPHPTTGIPLPAHGFEKLDALTPPETARVPATDVITRAAALLMNASADNLGMAADGEPHLDLREARELITALAGLLAASQEYLGEQAAPLHDGLKTLQAAFREASSVPDEPGHGPGEKLIG